MSTELGLTDTERLHREFWTAFGHYLQQHRSFLNPQKPQPQNWTQFAIGRSGFSLTALANVRDKYIAVELMIKTPEAKGFFRALEQDKAEIEAALSLKLEWRGMPKKKMSVVSIYNRGIDAGERDQWDLAFAWFHTTLEAFHETFAPRVETLEPVE